MNSLKTWKTDIMVMLLGSIVLLFYYGMLVHQVERGAVIVANLLLAFLIVRCYPLKVQDDVKIYKNKKCIGIFMSITIVTIIVGYMFNRYLILNYISTANKMILGWLIYLVLTLLLLMCYIFGVKLSHYRWNMNIKMLLFVGAIYIMYRIIPIIMAIVGGYLYFDFGTLKDFIAQGIARTIYPGIFEEVLCRGFLISGLTGFGVSDNKSNVIQSVVFGVLHMILGGGMFSWVGILPYAAQTLMGYVLGRLYFKTKSLTPCILLHGLMNIVLPFWR